MGLGLNADPDDRSRTVGHERRPHGANLRLKFIADRVVAGALAIAVAPLVVLIAAAMIVEAAASPSARGPLLIGDPRITEGRPFRMWKFRTFRPVGSAATSTSGTDIDAGRPTRVGRLLRKLYLDELPQLANVLAGDMSLVEPRPVPEDMYLRTLDRGYQAKRVLRAGFCGPVQALKGRWREIGTYLDADEVLVEEYERRSAFGVLALDAVIMWRTFRKVVDTDGLDSPYG